MDVRNIINKKIHSLEEIKYFTANYDFFNELNIHIPKCSFSEEELKFIVSNLNSRQLELRIVHAHLEDDDNNFSYAMQTFVEKFKYRYNTNIDFKELVECMVDNNINLYDKYTAMNFIIDFYDFLSAEYLNKIVKKILINFSEFTDYKYLKFILILKDEDFDFLLKHNARLQSFCNDVAFFEILKSISKGLHYGETYRDINVRTIFRLFEYSKKHYSVSSNKDVYLYLLDRVMYAQDAEILKKNHKEVFKKIGQVISLSLEYQRMGDIMFFKNNFFLNNECYSSKRRNEKRTCFYRFLNIMSEFLSEKDELKILKSLRYKYWGYDNYEIKELYKNCKFSHAASTKYLRTQVFLLKLNVDANV
jgi:hypothetical protein